MIYFVLYYSFIFENHIFKKRVLLQLINRFRNDKILDPTKLKAFADDNITVAEKMISLYDWLENIVGKGEKDCFGKG